MRIASRISARHKDWQVSGIWLELNYKKQLGASGVGTLGYYSLLSKQIDGICS